MHSDTDRAADALHYLDAGCDRETWHKTGRAGLAAGLPIEVIDAWSATGGNYKGTQDVTAAFRTVKPEGGTGAGTLFFLAREAGWTDGKTGPQRQAPAQSRPPEPTRKPAPGMAATEVWARLEPATYQHPYIVAKAAAGVPLADLRRVPADDAMTIQGERMAGALVVPCVRPDGTFSTLQFIALPEVAARLKAKGTTSKLNLRDCRVEGWFTVGTPVPGGVVYVCEGVGTAWSCYQATGQAAVSCFGVSNMRKVAAELRERDPRARLVIVPDVGKHEQAEAIAKEVQGFFVTMPEGEANNFDANDLAQRDGFDVLELLLESATEPPKPAPRLKPVSVADLFTHPSPPPEFAWESYCPLDEVTLFAANGGTGKSVIGLMLAVSVALGRPLFDVPTKPGRVLFASLEDGADLVRHRLAGICRAWQIDPVQLHGRLTVVDGTEHPELFTAENHSAGDVTSSYAEMRRLAEDATLVLIDNASDAFGGDEIKRREVRAFVRVLKAVAKAEHCAVVLLAHVNAMTARARKPDNDEGYSGSTAWNNSVRSRLFLSRDELGLLTLAHQKANLSKRREPINLQWLDDGLPELVQAGPGFDGSRQQGRADDKVAAALLVLISEFESRGQYCHTGSTSRSNPFALLRSEPGFQSLKLNADSTKRIMNQCQRAGWITSLDYRTPDRKPHQRWTLTADGRNFAGLPAAPTAPTAPTTEDGTSQKMAQGGAPTAPTCIGGVGGRARTEDGAEVGACND